VNDENQTTNGVDRQRLRLLMTREEEQFVHARPQSHALFQRARHSLLSGVPMNWMVKWAGAFPIFVKEAKGAHFTDVDGHEYVDLCLGDTGAMTGHSPEPAVRAMTQQLQRGITFMLPTEDSIWVGEELKRRFGLPYWQFCLTATDANRFSIRLAREITQRQFVLVFNYCYHGTVDETFISLKDGMPVPRRGNVGAPVNPAVTSRVIEFNDVDALERVLSARDVACVLAEPVMTNVGIVHAEPEYHEALRELTRKYGTMLIIDEIHTICTGPGGTHENTTWNRISSFWGSRSQAGCPRQPSASVPRLESASFSVCGLKIPTLAASAVRLQAMRFHWRPCAQLSSMY